jgi:hypothetical protein
MAILWADNFQTYGQTETNLLDGVYAEIDSSTTLQTDPDPAASGNVLRVQEKADTTAPYEGSFLRFVFPGAALGTVGVAARIWCSVLPTLDGIAPQPFVLIDSNGDRQLTLQILPDGRLELIRGTILGTTLATSTLPVITAQAWNHIEFKATIDNSVGATEVRVNGVAVDGLTLTNVDTRNGLATVSSVAFQYTIFSGSSANRYMYVKDFVVWDTTGSQNNDFLGSVQVYTLQLDADASFNWTASTGSTGYNLIDELTPNDADYISADVTQTTASTFTFEDLPSDIVGVKALLSVARMRKTDGGDGQVQMAFISNGDTDSGADRPITTAFTYWWDVSELSPDTAAAWTPVEVNAATVSIDRTV